MNRRLALAGSVSAATALVAGAVMVGTLLSQGPERTDTPDLAASTVDTGSATVTSQEPVVVYQDEVEYVVTDDGTRRPSAPPDETEAGTVGAAAPSTPGPLAATAPVASPVPTAAPTTTVAPRATTTTTRPPGVPKDWPADKPIPPMPPNCREPQLEDNGVWNCQH